MADLDVISARNRRIEELKGDYDREMRRAVDAEAKIEELERLLDDAEALIRRQRDERKALEARAEKLAEAVEDHCAHDDRCGNEKADFCECGVSVIDAALAAFRSPEPQPAEGIESSLKNAWHGATESEPHPDTVRLDWMDRRAVGLGNRAVMFSVWGLELSGVNTLREAIDAVREGESE